MTTPGYSGKALSDKLGIKPGGRIAMVRAPSEAARLLAPLPAGAVVIGPRARAADCVLLFATRRLELVRDLPPALSRLAPGGMCWICWPKRSSGVATDVTEQLLRDVVLPTGWVDVKVCAVSDTWSGLKFLRRRAR